MTTIGPRDPKVETREQFIARVVAAAPPLTDEMARRIAKLLPMPSHVELVARGLADDERTDSGAA